MKYFTVKKTVIFTTLPYFLIPLIEAGSQIQAGSLTEAGGLKANIIELIAHTPVALWCIASFVRIA